MKPPAERVHFAVSDEPLTEGSIIRVLCGKDIWRAKYAATGDREFVHVSDFIAQVMRRCNECADKATFAAGNYLYAIRSGQPQISQEENSDECLTNTSH